jgi:hypothetical protein
VALVVALSCGVNSAVGVSARAERATPVRSWRGRIPLTHDLTLSDDQRLVYQGQLDVALSGARRSQRRTA